MLIIVCGNIAAGKSTTARMLQEENGGIILQTNVIRNKVYPNPTYSDEEVSHVYELLYEKVKEELAKEQTVILDATFSQMKYRKKAIEIAEELGKKFYVIEVIGPDDLVSKKRIIERVESINKTSYEGYKKVKDQFEPVLIEKTVIVNKGSVSDLRKKVSTLSF